MKRGLAAVFRELKQSREIFPVGEINSLAESRKKTLVLVGRLFDFLEVLFNHRHHQLVCTFQLAEIKPAAQEKVTD